MSAILGLCRWDGRSLAATALSPALETLVIYGEVTSEPWIAPGVALASRWRSWSSGAADTLQPLRDGTLTLVADARLDGRDELCRELAIDPAERGRVSDARLILLAYRRWGVDCPSHLLGDYAFAVWDNAARSLYLARDPVGARPLYFHVAADGMAFATDIPALLQLPDVPRRLDLDEVARYVGYAPPHPPFYLGIERLPPAHWLLAGPTGSRRACYWQPLEQAAIVHPHPEDYVEHLHELLSVAVADRCRAACPVASHFSGGLDSSLVTLYASRHLRGAGRTLAAAIPWAPARSPTYPEYPDDERNVLDRLAADWGLALRYSGGEINEFYEGVQLNPFHDNGFGLFDERAALRLAGQAGTGLLLSGTGGDAALSAHDQGYSLALLGQGEWRSLAAYWTRLWTRRGWRGVARQTLEQLLLPWLPDATYLEWQRSTTHHPMVSPLLQHRHHALIDTRRHPRLHARTRPDPRRMALTQLAIDGWRLEGCARWAAEFGLEQTYPLLDRRVLDFSFGKPPQLLWHDGRSRYLPRALLRREGAELFWDRDKRDPANEAKRAEWRADAAQRLLRDVHEGRWQNDPHGVVDMNSFGRALDVIAERQRQRQPLDLHRLAEIHLALRVMGARP